MKKTVSWLMVVLMLFVSMPVYATDTVTAADTVTATDTAAAANTQPAVSEEQIAAQEAAVTDAEINSLIAIPDQEAIVAEDDRAMAEADADKQLTAETAAPHLKRIYAYLVKRDRYYKRVLTVIDRVYATDNRVLKKLAIIEFEKRYAAEKERDRKIHHKIKKALKFLRDNKSRFTVKQRTVIARLFKPVIVKYLKHRRVIIHIHKRIQEIKLASSAEDVKNLAALAEQARGKGDMKKARELYEKVMATGAAGKDTVRKAGEVLAQAEGPGPKVFVRGTRPDFDVKPVIRAGRTLVPLRAIAEALKAKVTWNEKTRTVILVKGDTIVQMTIGQKVILVNGQRKTVDVAAAVINNRTLVPLRTVSETLDANVTWDSDTEMVTIEDNLTDSSQDVAAAELSDTGLGSAQDFSVGATDAAIVNEVQNLDEQALSTELP